MKNLVIILSLVLFGLTTWANSESKDKNVDEFYTKNLHGEGCCNTNTDDALPDSQKKAKETVDDGVDVSESIKSKR